MIRMSQVKIKCESALAAKKRGGDGLKALLTEKAAAYLKIPPEDILRMEICRESIDARKKPELYFVYTVELLLKEEKRLPGCAAAGDKERNTGSKGRGTGLQERNTGSKGQRRSVPAGIQIESVLPVTYRFPESGTESLKHPPVIVGMGPAGLFCGYYLALHGYRPILLERGRKVEERQADVERFWQTGVLDVTSNVQFGEGGAGAFSDGKLNTLVKDKDGRNREVLKVLAECGAEESILYEAKPHIGTDALCDVVRRMRERIVESGGEVRYETLVSDLDISGGRIRGVRTSGGEYLPCDRLVLATGHSARDTFAMLHERQIPMEAKAFAVGLRVEHPQEMINLSQYGMADTGELGAAPYKLTARADNGRAVYSFCMCPGGYVVNASSEEGRLAVNGMSYSGRNGVNANSAVIVSVTSEDYGSSHPLAGVDFQRKLEERAFALADGRIPMQRYGAFKACVERQRDAGAKGADGDIRAIEVDSGIFLEDNAICEVMPAHKGLSAWADVSSILPEECNRALVQGMESFGRQIKGFDREDAILSGVESRTSSPVRIRRDESLQSEVRGLYPCGEGAGYAGGITSAAMDGLRVAERIAAVYAPFSED
ncbi:MAG: FAD-dependent oxidoreductase [Clostridium sp.]|nr:FAD-dependent oxidoreductase [Acetatifactor muris]MCM1527665.1 FAD-binding protein [Bacteroides sp.]MCM1563391.1 FAD-dependent oxidoreductase [Clostridium sp.]